MTVGWLEIWPRRAAKGSFLRSPVMAMAIVTATSFQLGGCGRSEPPLPLPPAMVDIVMDEYRFDVEQRLPAGRTVLRVTNAGEVDHEMVVVTLPEDFPPLDAQLRGDVRRPVGGIVAIVRARPPGSSRTLALELDAGRYGLICFLRDADDVPHARKGMSAELQVG